MKEQLMQKELQQATQNSATGGLGLSGVLTAIFAAAKVFGFTTMSWLWVLCPIWISALIALGIVGITLIVVIMIAGIQAWRD